MSTRILFDITDSAACLYDSVTGLAFGEIFEGEEAYEDAERFLDWLAHKDLDARDVQPNTLRELRSEFSDQNERRQELA